jgi:uncharacterized protein YndB with AHSA1/START domain
MTETKDVNIVRIFDAPRARVWEAWTDPEEIKKWWGPEGFSAPSVEQDLRTGGKFVYAMQGPPGSEWEATNYSGGEYLEVVPMEKIVAREYFCDKDGNKIDPATIGMPGEWPEYMTVTFLFEDAGEGKTKLTLRHEGHPVEMASNAEQGWSSSLNKFTAIL